MAQCVVVVLSDGEFLFGEFHFTNVYGVIGTFYHEVYLHCPVRGISLAAPRINIGRYAGDAQFAFDFVDVASRENLERNARPGIKARSALQGSPILAVAERTITHKPEVEQGEEVYQLEQRLAFATSVIVVSADKTAGFKVVKNGSERLARLYT